LLPIVFPFRLEDPMSVRTYKSPEDFKQALEQRLRASSKTGLELERRRQLLVYDRFLARIMQVMQDTVILKGGLVLELRLGRARTTKDIDLRLVGSPREVLERLQYSGRLDLGDFLAFEVQPDPHHPDIQNDGMPYGGRRFRTKARLAGKLYGRPFGVDVGFADPILGDPDIVVARNILEFAGIQPPTLLLYPVETHIAEKLHAYTIPRERENSRVRDLPDLALLGKVRPIKATSLRQAFQQTFEFRKTHPVPNSLPDPPASWAGLYERMAQEDQLEWSTLAQVTAAVRSFLTPVLDGTAASHWSPGSWLWNESA
jgi:hypothetical protein